MNKKDMYLVKTTRRQMRKLNLLGNENAELGLKRALSNCYSTDGNLLQRQIDSVNSFTDLYLVKVGVNKGVLLSDLYFSYKEYCCESCLKVMTKMKFVEQLNNLGFMYGTGTGNTRWIFGAQCNWL